jgi:hypothetical protein
LLIATVPVFGLHDGALGPLVDAVRVRAQCFFVKYVFVYTEQERKYSTN